MSAPTSTVATDLTTIVFSKNNCPMCTSSKAQLDLKGVPFVEINVEEDTAPRDEFDGLTPLEYVVKNYGRQMPTIVVTDDLEQQTVWSGARVDKIVETVGRYRDAGLLTTQVAA